MLTWSRLHCVHKVVLPPCMSEPREDASQRSLQAALPVGLGNDRSCVWHRHGYWLPWAPAAPIFTAALSTSILETEYRKQHSMQHSSMQAKGISRA